ncbi:MAG: CerR family C-terminal domain-containing protein [Holophaga sp.]
MDENSKSSPRGESTRDALLDAATLVFAREGFASANLRQIAQAAGANPALIGYHFHSKDGLYLAVFQRIVAGIGKTLGPILDRIDRELAVPAGAEPRAEDRRSCLDLLLAFVEGLLVHLVHEHPAWGELIAREMGAPSTAFDLLYQGAIGRGQGALVGLLRRIRPGADLEQTRLLAAAIAAQVLLLRHARAPFMRLLGWEAIGPRELDVMKAQIRRNITLLALGD